VALVPFPVCHLKDDVPRHSNSRNSESDITFGAAHKGSEMYVYLCICLLFAPKDSVHNHSAMRLYSFRDAKTVSTRFQDNMVRRDLHYDGQNMCQQVGELLANRTVTRGQVGKVVDKAHQSFQDKMAGGDFMKLSLMILAYQHWSRETMIWAALDAAEKAKAKVPKKKLKKSKIKSEEKEKGRHREKRKVENDVTEKQQEPRNRNQLLPVRTAALN